MKTLTRKLLILFVFSLPCFYASASENFCTGSSWDMWHGNIVPMTKDGQKLQWKDMGSITQKLKHYKIGCFLDMYRDGVNYNVTATGRWYCAHGGGKKGVVLLQAGNGHDLIFRNLEEAKDFEKDLFDNVSTGEVADKTVTIGGIAGGVLNIQFVIAVGYFTGSTIKSKRVSLYNLTNPWNQDALYNPCYYDNDAEALPVGEEFYKYYAYPFPIDDPKK